ncbi:hypothetical protein RN001_002155 [Aquatica leii]|uniref:Uncharacterized protein n=1 Tax=Aquatica leii TaxID=1421715 RepID=A0AAN7SLP7_9COLE|nr:hypothetical protein RN001_002155 [Aquatica leii]
MFVPSSLTERQDTALHNPGASSQVGLTAVNDPGPSPSNTINTSDALIDEQNIDTHLGHVTPQKKLSVTPADLLPLPKVIPKKKKQGVRRRGKTAIITASPYLNELKEKQAMASTPPNRNTVKRKLSETVSSKSIKTRKRNTSNSSDSELSNIELCQDSSDNNSNFIGSPDSDNVIVSEPFTLSQSKILVDDFVLVPMTDQKTGIEKTFVAQVTKIAMENETDVLYHVKFMRNYRQHLDIFVFPDIDDTSEIYKGDIAGVLKSFMKLRYGKIKFY